MVLLFVATAFLGWTISVQQNEHQLKIKHQLENFHISLDKINHLNAKRQEQYLNFLKQNKRKIITYQNLIKKINNGEYISVDYALINIPVTKSMYVVDVFKDKTEDYFNNQKLYDQFLDTKPNNDKFINKTIVYRDNKIFQIKEVGK